MLVALFPCYCRRSLARARVRAEIKVNGASFLLMVQSESPARAKPGVTMCLLQNLADLAAMTRYLAALGRRRPDQAMPHRRRRSAPKRHRRPESANNNCAKTNTLGAGQRHSTTPPAPAGRAGRSLLLPPLSRARAREGGD